MFAYFQSFGNLPASSDFLNSIVIGSVNSSAKILGWILSGPCALFLSSLINNFLTDSLVISKLSVTLSYSYSWNSGSGPALSVVNRGKGGIIGQSEISDRPIS